MVEVVQTVTLYSLKCDSCKGYGQIAKDWTREKGPPGGQAKAIHFVIWTRAQIRTNLKGTHSV